jgi:hypothetical protein
MPSLSGGDRRGPRVVKEALAVAPPQKTPIEVGCKHLIQKPQRRDYSPLEPSRRPAMRPKLLASCMQFQLIAAESDRSFAVLLCTYG